MSDASTYPITENFGWQQGYPLHTTPSDPAVPATEKTKYPGAGYGFHTGVDWGCPSGTPIVVNGVVIGLSGATGEVFGPHVHVGKFSSGICVNPGSPWNFTSAVVTEIAEDSTNGKYVRIQADGSSYVYLHMSDNTKVEVGQELKGATVKQLNRGDIVNVYRKFLGHDPTDNDFEYHLNQKGADWNEFTYDLMNNRKDLIQDAQARQITDLQAQLAQQGAELKPGKYFVK